MITIKTPGRRKGYVMEENREKTGQRVYRVALDDVGSRKELHERLRRDLPLPDYYGGNLDAFYDVLTEFGNGWDVRFTGCGPLREILPAYMNALTGLCRHAVEEMENLTITFED